MTASSGHTMASAAQGSESAVSVSSAISERGLRNWTFAHTPRRLDSRWLSQRSTPLAGTSTSSVANGSADGCASSAPRPSAS